MHPMKHIYALNIPDNIKLAPGKADHYFICGLKYVQKRIPKKNYT